MTYQEMREEIALMRRTQPANAVSVNISLEFMNALFDAVDKLDAVPVDCISTFMDFSEMNEEASKADKNAFEYLANEIQLWLNTVQP